jgi:putative membrane protein
MSLSRLLVGIIALEHVAFMVLEMFLWTRPLGRKVFKLTEAQARDSKSLAMNQGLYNGFLAAGLLFSDTQFFLGCVVAAGVFGGLTAKRSILWVQALPAAVAMLLIWLVQRGAAL